MRIAKAVIEGLSITAGSSDKEWPLECLSRVLGNSHAAFLKGEGDGNTSPLFNKNLVLKN